MKHKSYISVYIRLCHTTEESECSSFHFEIIVHYYNTESTENTTKSLFFLFKSSIEAGMKISELLFCHE